MQYGARLDGRRFYAKCMLMVVDVQEIHDVHTRRLLDVSVGVWIKWWGQWSSMARRGTH